MKKYILLICIVFCPKLVAAAPQILWESKVLEDSVVGLRVGAYTQPSSIQIALLSLNAINLFQINSGQLDKIGSYALPPHWDPIRLSRYDFQGDGSDELIVTGFQKGRVQSLVLSALNGQWKLLQEVPFHINVINQEGQSKLIGQKQFGQEDYSGSPFLVEGIPPSLKSGTPLNLRKGLWTKNIGLYSLNGFKNDGGKNRYLVMDQTGYLNVAEEGSKGFSKIWGSGESYGGAVYHLDFDIRNVLNELVKTHFEIPVRFVFDDTGVVHDMRGNIPVEQPLCDARENFWHPPCIFVHEMAALPTQTADGLVYVIKNSDYLKSVAGAVPAIKNSQLILLKWNGQSLQETWNSPRLDGGLSDFDLIQFDGDSAPEVIAVNVLRGRGYWETQKGFKSKLIVLDPKAD